MYSKTYLVGSKEDIQQYIRNADLYNVQRIYNKSIDPQVKKFENGEFEYADIMRGRSFFENDEIILINKSESTKKYLETLIRILSSLEKPNIKHADINLHNKFWQHPVIKESRSTINNKNNWRRYILVGSESDILKYIDDQPFPEQALYYYGFMDDLLHDISKNDYPLFLSGTNQQNADVILINATDSIYDYVKEKFQPVINAYHINTKPRLYMARV